MAFNQLIADSASFTVLADLSFAAECVPEDTYPTGACMNKK